MNNAIIETFLIEFLEKKHSKDISVFHGLKGYKKHYMTEQVPGQGASTMTSMTSGSTASGGTGPASVKSGAASGGGAGVGLVSPRKRAKDIPTMISGEADNIKKAMEMTAATKGIEVFGGAGKVLGGLFGANMIGKGGAGGLFGGLAAAGLGNFVGDTTNMIGDILGGDVVTANIFGAGKNTQLGILSQAGHLPSSGLKYPAEKQGPPPINLDPKAAARDKFAQDVADAELRQRAIAAGVPIPP